MDTNNELKPGDRVILTGWVNDYQKKLSETYWVVFRFPVEAVFDGAYFKPNEMQWPFERWHTYRFTYKKIETNGNG